MPQIDSYDQCMREIAKLVAGAIQGGPILRIGTASAAGGGRVTVGGISMPHIDVGVAPSGGDLVAYLRQGPTVVALGALA